MALRLGINPLTWTNDDMPELGGETPLEVCLAEAREAGYEGIEMGRKFPRRAADLGPILARHGLALVSGWYSAELLTRSVADEIAAVADHVALMAEMDCAVIVFCDTTGSVHGLREAPLSGRPRLDDERWPAFGAALTEVAEHVMGRGVRMAYHHHMGTVVQTEEEIDRLMACTGEAVGLLLDTGHLAYSGGDPLAVIRRHGGRLVHVHCKDMRPEVLARVREADASFLDAVLAGVFTVPGDGCIDYAALVRELAGTGYSGWLVVEAEQDPAVAHPLTYARKGFEGLNAAIAAAGL